MTATPRELLLDVSRLIWRGWRRHLPTGIDRVCLEYVAHFGSRAQAVVNRRGSTFVLSASHSDRLFDLILNAPSNRRAAFVALGSAAWTRARRDPPAQRMTYLNVGHTGLDDAALPKWIARHSLRAVYLIHDMIPPTHPEYCRPGEAPRHQRRILNALASASGVIGNSETTIRDVVSFAKQRGLKMPPATVAWISGPPASADPAPKIFGHPYYVTLGTIEGRKNHLMLLQVWRRIVAELGEQAPKLIIIGQRGWEAEGALALIDRAPDLRNAVLELSDCGDAEAASWLAGARALLMPSLAEGFGLPVIEALQLGTPVIASDLPVYREVVGSLPTYLDPLDGPAWQRVVRAFVSDDNSERVRQLRALRHYEAPTWSGHFKQVEAWLSSL